MLFSGNKNRYCQSNLEESWILFSISFLANSDVTTSNVYETTTSTTTSTESDVNTYDVNNSDVNIPDGDNSDVNISETLALNSLPSSDDLESTHK